MTGAEPEKQAAEQSEAPAPAKAPNAETYEATVTAEEAPLLVRLMANAGITPGRTGRENGEVTFRVAEAQKDTLTAQLLNDETYANARRNSDEQNSRDECRAAIDRIVVSMAATNARFYNAYYGSPLAAQRFRDHLFQTTYRSAEAEQAAPAPVSTAALYHEALGLLVSAVRGSSFYDYLRDRDTNYDSCGNLN